MKNMELYEAFRKAPESALKAIRAGKLTGKTDINPMWRIKVLTERFGPCGVGWNTRNVKYEVIPGANGEVVVSCELDLVYRLENGEWSDPVHGIGGNMLVQTQRGALATNDDAFKSAYTDAISVAAKALGVAADVYWNTDTTKYTRYTQSEQTLPPEIQNAQPVQTSPEVDLSVAQSTFATKLRLYCQQKNCSQESVLDWLVETYIKKPVEQFTVDDYKAAQKRIESAIAALGKKQ